MSFEEQAEEIWDKWRRNEISHEEVQKELELILGAEPSGFFVELGDNLKGLVSAKIPIEYRQTYTYEEIASKRDKIREKIINKTNWASFWQFHANMLTAPSSDEVEHLKQMDNHTLIEYFKLICISLKQLINNNLESSEIAQNLHGYYKLIKEEINSRNMCKLPKTDAFREYIQHKKQYKEDLEKMENARLTGSMCPYCDSTNVRSYGLKEWKCYGCGKRFRKH